MAGVAVEWRRARARRGLISSSSSEGNRNCFLRWRFHRRTNLKVEASFVFIPNREGILVTGPRSTARGIGFSGYRRRHRRPPEQRRYLTLPSPVSVMKSFPVDRGHSVSLALFSDVSNSRELLDLMQSGKLEPEVAFLNASLVPDVFPVLAAAHKALLSKARESLTTRTLHSELVYNISGSKHVISLASVAFASYEIVVTGYVDGCRSVQITESLKRCGIADDTKYILAARFDASDEEMKEVEKLISGAEIDLAELETRANQAQILKHYKITPQELSISTLADAIVCRIAARDAL
ncbi:hypothetical protein PR202_ga23514 [Eleusine coracana subsp. coracana]|uniref:EKC/KEOPS complex subunit CGI121 n=1 Tax=Eleusine coracana subsp. coracana TaxID=191504 RepID=A0AAV5D5W5_ELECO|nr:hypothetical protein PR202_ga23514 [Eleusine coracana subsp. coracana]